MMFTTFLFALAVVTALVLGGMLLTRKRDAEETKVPAALAFVAAAAIALTALGIAMA